jgi:hypothetical protein
MSLFQIRIYVPKDMFLYESRKKKDVHKMLIDLKIPNQWTQDRTSATE